MNNFSIKNLNKTKNPKKLNKKKFKFKKKKK